MNRVATSTRAPRARVPRCAAALALAASCAPGPAAAPSDGATSSFEFPTTPTGGATISVAEAGDPCGATVACSADGTSFLRCEAGRMVVQGVCRGQRRCEANGRVARCDQSIAELGDTCDGGASCSLDGLNMLACRDGRRVLKSACTTGCEVQRKMKAVSCYGTALPR
jgi:hypothetical protein